MGRRAAIGRDPACQVVVPRRMAWLGLIGGPLLLIGNIGVLFDWWDQTGAVNVLVIPEFLWELSLGIYLVAKGFRRDAPILADDAPVRVPEPPSAMRESR